MAYDQHRKPPISSYDSGYEHSVEHWLETRRLVEEADALESIENESRASSARRAMAADTCAKEY